jgi:protein-arginine kinase activator protein McsA
VELHLCKDCSAKYMDMAPETTKQVKQEAVPQPPPAPPAPTLLSSFLTALLGAMLAKTMQQPQQPKSQLRNAGKPPCPSCGMTVRKLAENGKVGCATCWEHFSEELKIVAKHSHAGATQHVGKSPKVNKPVPKTEQPVDQNASIEERIKSYRLKMAKAIEIENYEAAGALKKQIESLQAQLTGAPPPTPPSSVDQ